jgi:hypothetical protein
MSSLTQYEASIRRHVQLALMQCGSNVSRATQLSSLFLQAMLMVRISQSRHIISFNLSIAIRMLRQLVRG